MRRFSFGRWMLMGGAITLVATGCTPKDEVVKPPGEEQVTTPPGIGFPGLGGRVNALQEYGGDMVAGGEFLTAAGDSVWHIAAWNGKDWRAFGTGVIDDPGVVRQGGEGGLGTVNALAVYDGKLIVGGRFDTASGTPTSNIARWDGTTWSTFVQGGPNGPVKTLLADGTRLYVAGSFTTVGGTSARNVAVWDGSTWQRFAAGIGSPLNLDAEVVAATLFEGRLVVGGTFASAADTLANNVARWTGTRWEPFGAGVDGTVLAFGIYQDRLYASGLFGSANGTWSNEVAVDPTSDAGRFAALRLDTDGNPHVAYYDASALDARYAFFDGSGWNDELIDAAGDVGSFMSLRLRDDGTPTVSYYDATNADLKFASRPGGSWIVETPVTEGDVGSHSSLALDGDDRAHITYYRADTESLFVATRQGPDVWFTELVDGGVNLADPSLPGDRDVGRASRLEIDDRGRFHVAYYDAFNRSARYAIRTTSWSRQFLIKTTSTDPTATKGQYLALAVDANGTPHALVHEYRGNVNGGERLEYAIRSGGSWSREQVEAPGTGIKIGRFPSIAIDRDGKVHASYQDVTQQRLRYAFRGGPLDWRRISPDNGGVGAYTSLVLEDGRSPRVAYYDQSSRRLKFARRASGSPVRRIACWDGSAWTPLSTGVNWWARTLIVHDGELLVGGTFTEAGGSGVLRIARWNGSSWAGVANAPNAGVWVFAPFQGGVIAGGEFTSVGPFTAKYIVELD